MSVTVHHGDSRNVLKGMADASIDSVVCDPPYALVSIGKRFGKDGAAPARAGKTGAYARASSGFMGQKWDTGEVAHDVGFWRDVLRVMKPGAHLIAFAGTRTYHRLAVAIEDAGFEIRDMVSWLYGSGFPKTHDAARAIDRKLGAKREVVGSQKAPGYAASNVEHGEQGRSTLEFSKTSDEAVTPDAARWTGWKSALKPAMEPCVLGRKPLDGTMADNLLKWGVGALNIDASRVPTDDKLGGGAVRANMGRANHEGWRRPWMDDEEASAAYAARQRASVAKGEELGRYPANVIHDGSDEVVSLFPESNGSGSARTLNRSGGLRDNGWGMNAAQGDEAQLRDGGSGSVARFFYSAKADTTDRLGTTHPTVKPIDLMAYLVKMITPPGGVVLDPFAGTGTTGVAAMIHGFQSILVEREEQYVADIHRRLKWARGEGRLTAQEKSRHQDEAPMGGLFASIEPDLAQGGGGRPGRASSTATSRGTPNRADGVEEVIS